MIIYLDESGDLGFNFDTTKTPRHFVITLLVCQDIAVSKKIKKAIERTLKNKINLKSFRAPEIKGAFSTLGIKKYFYNQIASDNWQLYSIVLDKKKFKKYSSPLPPEHRIYNYLSKEILTLVNLEILQNRLLLIVDKRKGKQGVSEFNKYLSLHIEARLPLNAAYDISHELSHQNYGLQAVDIFCWGIFRKYERNDNNWLETYEEKLVLIEADNFSGIKKDGP